MESFDLKEDAIDKFLANKLLKKLTSLFYDELKCFCDAAGYHIADLLPKSKDYFHDKNTPSEVENIRFQHFEETRIAKILKVSIDIASNPENHLYKSQSTQELMKQLKIPINSQFRNSKANSFSANDHAKSFQKPQDFFDYNYSKEQEKYQKSLKIIGKLSSIKETEKKKYDLKVKLMQDREKKLRADKEKREEKHEKNKEIKEEKRKQIFLKKCQIQDSVNSQCLEIGRQLEVRMKLLSEKEKKELRQKLKKKEEKIKEWISHDFQKIILDEIRIKQEEAKAENMIKELQEKIEKRVKAYENNVKKRIQTARSHSVKVEQQFYRILREDSAKREEKLKKMINKTMICEEKKDKRSEMYQESSDKLKSLIEKKFKRQLRVAQDVNEAEIKRLEEIEQRESQKQKTFYSIKSKIDKINQEKKSRNSRREKNHLVKYSITQKNYASNKEKILEKHQRLSQVVQEIKNHKDILSDLKRRRNFEVRDARSNHSSPTKQKYSNDNHLSETP